MSNCYGCKFGLENQLGHIGGCLPNYDSEPELESDDILILKIIPNTRTNLNGCLYPHETKKNYQLKLFVKVDKCKYMAVLYHLMISHTEGVYICREVSINNGKFEILTELETIPNQLMELISQ